MIFETEGDLKAFTDYVCKINPNLPYSEYNLTLNLILRIG